MTPAYTVATETLTVLLPELAMILVALAMMTVGAFVRLPRKIWAATTALTMVVGVLLLVAVKGTVPDLYSAVAINDALSGYSRLYLLLMGLVVVGLAHNMVDDARAAEFFGSLLLIHAGAMLVAAANELVLMFVGLELVSIPTYLLLYLPRKTTTTQEAATKYFFLSIFSSALLLFGMAYLYGLTGVSNLKALSFLVHSANLPHVPQAQLGVIAVVFMVAGLGFRVAAVPFHFYAPDVYQGSPTVVAALLAWVPKAVGFLAMIRALSAVLGGSNPVADKAVVLCWILAVVTMTLGNTVALAQSNLKRLLAYSSIAHAGYLMIGMTVAFRNDPTHGAAYLGTQGVLFYLTTYALMTLGAFGVVIAASTPERPVETVDDLAGLARSRPFLAVCMALCMFSLAGVPPMAGFWGKLQIFASALYVGAGDDAMTFQVLAIIGVLNAAIGGYYYLRIVVKMFFWPPQGVPNLSKSAWPTTLAVGACASLSLFFGLRPDALNSASREAAVAAIALPDPMLVPTSPPRQAHRDSSRTALTRSAINSFLGQTADRETSQGFDL